MKKLVTILCISLLLAGLTATAAESGPLAPVPFQKTGQASPVITSKFFMIDATVAKGAARVTLPMDTPQDAIALVLGESSVKAVAGERLDLEPTWFTDDELKRMNLPAANTRFNLDKLSSGMQELTFSGLKGKDRLHMVIAQPKSPLALLVQVFPLAARTGERVKITARLQDDKLPRTALIEAILPGMAPLSLADNGMDGDAAAGDGIYTGHFTAPGVHGFQGINIRFTARGERFDGTPFQRNAVNSVMVTEPRGKILKQSLQVGENVITLPLEAQGGRFRVDIIFGYQDRSLAYSREDIHLKGNLVEVKLPIPGEALAADRAVVRLLNKDTLGLEEEFEISLTPRQAPPDFESLVKKPQPLPRSKALAAEKMAEEEKDNGTHHH